MEHRRGTFRFACPNCGAEIVWTGWSATSLYCIEATCVDAVTRERRFRLHLVGEEPASETR